MILLDIYLIRNGITDDIVDACDDPDNANQLKDNLITIGEYRKLYVEKLAVSTDKIIPIEIVKISGNYTKHSLRVDAYNPTTPTADKLEFNVSATDGSITFEGFVNLTSAEQANFDLDAFKERVKTWVQSEFKIRLENDN